MAGADPPRIVVREYRRADRPQVEAFRCAPVGERWCEAAEKIIREAPADIASDEYMAGIAVAADGSTVVGVVVFGFETSPPRPHELVIFSLGVLRERHRRGIGTRLKEAVMAAAASDTNTVMAVLSRVHRANYRMIGLNDKLGVGKVKDPEDGEYLLTAVVVEPEEAPQAGE